MSLQKLFFTQSFLMTSEGLEFIAQGFQVCITKSAQLLLKTSPVTFRGKLAIKIAPNCIPFGSGGIPQTEKQSTSTV